MHLYVPESTNDSFILKAAELHDAAPPNSNHSFQCTKQTRVCKKKVARKSLKQRLPHTRVADKELLYYLQNLKSKRSAMPVFRKECLACITHSLTQSLESGNLDNDEQDMEHTFLGLLLLCKWTEQMIGMDFEHLIQSRVHLVVWRILCTLRPETEEEAEERRLIFNDPLVQKKHYNQIASRFSKFKLCSPDAELSLCNGCNGVGPGYLEIHFIATRFSMLFSSYASSSGRCSKKQLVHSGGLLLLLWLCHHKALKLPSNMECNFTTKKTTAGKPCAIAVMQFIVHEHVTSTYDASDYAALERIYKRCVRVKRLSKAVYLLDSHYELESLRDVSFQLPTPFTLLPAELKIEEAELHEKLVNRQRVTVRNKAQQSKERQHVVDARVSNSLAWKIAKHDRFLRLKAEEHEEEQHLAMRFQETKSHVDWASSKTLNR